MIHISHRFRCQLAMTLLVVVGACSTSTSDPKQIVRRYMEKLDRMPANNKRVELMRKICDVDNEAPVTEVMNQEYYGVYQLADDPNVDASAMKVLIDTIRLVTGCNAKIESVRGSYSKNQSIVVELPRFASDSSKKAFCDCISRYYEDRPVLK